MILILSLDWADQLADGFLRHATASSFFFSLDQIKCQHQFSRLDDASRLNATRCLYLYIYISLVDCAVNKILIHQQY